MAQRIIGLELGSKTIRAVVLDAGMRGYEIIGGATVPLEEAAPSEVSALQAPVEGAGGGHPAGEPAEPRIDAGAAGAEAEGGLAELLKPDFGAQGEASDLAPDPGEDAETAPAEGEAPYSIGGGEDAAAPRDPLAAALAVLGEKIGGLKADLVAVALPGGQTATAFVTLPFTESKKIDATLAFEVENLLPFDLDEAIYDYQIVSQADGKSELLVGVAREEEVRALLERLRSAGVDPRIVTLPGLANQALLLELIDREGLSPDETEGLLDLGEERTILSIARGASDPKHAPKLVFVRSTGGLRGGGEDKAALTAMIRELRQSLFSAQTRDRHPLRKLRLAGDLANVEGLAQRLERDLGVVVEPLEALPGEGAAKLDRQAPLAQALGLALRGHSRSSRLLNLRKGPLAFRGDLDYLKGKVSRLVAMAASIVFLIGMSIWTHASTLKEQEAALDDALCQMTQRAIGSCETDFNIAIAKLQGGDNKAAQIPTASAMEVFSAAVDHVPGDIDLRVDEIDAALDRLRIRGVVDSFDAVDQVVAELRKASCIGDVKPGRVQKNREEKIEFTLDALFVCGQNAGNAG